jgi:hypothetical protein
LALPPLEYAETGSWSKPFSRIVSMASVQGELVGIVVTGFRRREAMVALWKGSDFREAERVRESGEERDGVSSAAL